MIPIISDNNCNNDSNKKKDSKNQEHNDVPPNKYKSNK